MNSVNFDSIMQETIASFDCKKRLVLHVCCAPCLSGCIERVLPYFDTEFFFYNPNMNCEEEYNKRAQELCSFLDKFCKKQPKIAQYKHDEFLEKVKGKEDCPEKGERCFLCYRLRLEETAKCAKEHNADFFATTLTLSPLKNAQKLNEIGLELEKEYGVKYLCTDFKKRNGFLRSGELSEEFGLYRQNYCGCEFSFSK